MDPFFAPSLLGCALGGAAAGLLGAYVVGMRIPFMTVTAAHAALAGGVFGQLLGLPTMPCALVASVAAAMLIGTMPRRALSLDTNISMAVVFAATMGLVFLGIGLSSRSKTPMLQLLWGSPLFITGRDLAALAILAGLLIAFAVVFGKEMKAIVFSRELARYCGVHEGLVWGLFLALAGATLTVNLATVGGLMVFALVTCPAAAAYQVCGSWRAVVVASPVVGAGCALGGLGLAYAADLPAGATIVLLSCLVFGLSAGLRALRDRGAAGPSRAGSASG